jgi:lysozyme
MIRPVSALTINLIKSFEGCKLTAYKPIPDDPWTIGFGETEIDGKPVHEGQKITTAQAIELLTRRVEQLQVEVLTLVKVELNDHQLSVLVDFAYNCGISALAHSTLLILLNEREYWQAGQQFERFVHGERGEVLQDLVRRRHTEKELFLRIL